MKRGAARRRGRQEIKEQKLAEEQKKAEIEAKLARYEQMQHRVEQLEQYQND